MTKGLGRCVDAHEDDVCLGNVTVDLGRKEKVLFARLPHNFLQPGLINGKLVGLPRRDARLVDIHNYKSVFRTMAGKDRHCRPAHITSSDAKNVCHIYFLSLLITFT
jgi:hypothetical protein